MCSSGQCWHVGCDPQVLVIPVFRHSQGRGHCSNLRNLHSHSCHQGLQESRTLAFNENSRPWSHLSIAAPRWLKLPPNSSGSLGQ